MGGTHSRIRGSDDRHSMRSIAGVQLKINQITLAETMQSIEP
jgi:hypothetical protein